MEAVYEYCAFALCETVIGIGIGIWALGCRRGGMCVTRDLQLVEYVDEF